MSSIPCSIHVLASDPRLKIVRRGSEATHVHEKKILNKNKNIIEKMSE